MKKYIYFFLALIQMASLAPSLKLMAIDPTKRPCEYVQDNWRRQPQDGLPDNMVNCVIQDREGYLWLATAYGLARFDGVYFTTYNKYNCEALTGNLVMSVYEDKEGVLWIGSRGGLVRLKEGKMESFFKSINSHDFVWTVYEDSKRNLWIGTEGDGIRCLKDGKLIAYSEQDGLSSNFIRAICEDDEGAIWIGTRKGLNRFKEGKFTIYMEKDGLPHNFVRAIYNDSKGNLWLGTYGGGLCRWENNKFSVYTTKNGLPDEFIRTIYEDSRGALWVGTRKGLARLKNGTFTIFCVANEVSPYNLINSVCEDNEKNLWIGTESLGLIRLKEATFRSFTQRNGLAESEAYCIYTDKRDTLWVGMRDGLYYFKEGKFNHYTAGGDRFDYVIDSICEDSEGNLWVGTESRGLKRVKNGKVSTYGKKEGLESAVRCLYADTDGVTWIGTYDAGLVRYKNGDFKTYTTQDGLSSNSIKVIYKDRRGLFWIGTDSRLDCFRDGVVSVSTRQKGLAVHNISVIYEDPEGTLWFGSNENGLTRFKNGNFTVYSTREGLQNDAVYQVLEDRKGNLWLGSKRGISCVNKKELNDVAEGKKIRFTYKSYDEADGMITGECTGSDSQPSGAKTTDGKLWFTLAEGVAMVNPEELKKNTIAPRIRIEQLTVNNKTTEIYSNTPKKTIMFPPGRYDFVFKYTAFSFYAPGKIVFKIMLEGFDKEWKFMDTRRTAYYTNIPPGKYRFLVIACNNDRVWNMNMASLNFILKPYFYQTWWFFMLAGMALIFLALGLYRFRVNQLKNRQLELEKLVHKRTHQLEESNRQLEESNQAKSQFLARMSHEIQTPMNGVIGFTDLLLETGLDKKQVDYARTIASSGATLTRMLNNILDFSRIEAGKLTINAVDFDPGQTAANVVESTRPRAENKSLTLEYRLSANLPALVKGDALRVRQVLLNLLENAVKFTEKGQIELNLDVEEETGTKIKFHIKVRDTGIGIPGDKLERIFDAFQQVDGSDTREHGGAGLGLSICRQLARLMGGDVWAESTLGQGSTFHFTAWMEKSAPPLPLSKPATPALHILLAEDNPINQKLARFIFTSAGYQVTVANNGNEVVEIFTTAPESFDMIFMDIQMPQMSGIEATQLIREKGFKNIPIIAITALSMKGDREKCLDAGMDDYIAKPVKKEALLELVRKWGTARESSSRDYKTS
jgi:signal transduction histidine kinase/streptogramin lyase/ActR/RegA family two-component response regulator